MTSPWVSCRRAAAARTLMTWKGSTAERREGSRATGMPPTLAGRSDDQTVSPNTHTNSVMVTAVMAINPIRLSQIPPRIIWPMVTYPEP